MIVAGEALVDLVPADLATREALAGKAEAPGSLRTIPGGSPLNVAVGLARLGVATHYLGRLSTDPFGTLLRSRLESEGVLTTLATATDAPTTLAVVHLDDAGDADYRFYLDGTSAADVEIPRVLPPGALHVSLGAVGLAHPAGRALADLLGREEGRRVRSLDPNVRASSGTTARLLEAAVSRADLVKASAEDLETVYDEPAGRVATRWIAAAHGPALVVVTRGRDGASALSRGGRIDVTAVEVDVVDTVGAGDAFTAGLLAALDERGVLVPGGLDATEPDVVRESLTLASRSAAITCTRRGADPPRRDER